MLPLQGLIVLEFSQYLSGPSAGLRLADLGARVIKIERPVTGDPSRKLSIKNLWVGDDALNFHAINRNKESFTANLKDEEELALVKKLIQKADVLTHNFRPGVMEKAGLAYKEVAQLNPAIIYAEITGYGKKGPWKDKPGQDLLIQSLSGLAFTTGNSEDNPLPFGLSVVDSICGIHMVQGILAAMIRRQKTGQGAYIELSLLESAIAFQFELFTTWFLNKQAVKRSKINNGNPLLGAPYGIYKTSDGFIALAMMDISLLQQALNMSPVADFDQDNVFSRRDEIKSVIASIVEKNTTGFWISRLKEYGLWAAAVNNWNDLVKEEGYKTIAMEQQIELKNGNSFTTTRCPIRLNGKRLVSSKPAPALGEHNSTIRSELHV